MDRVKDKTCIVTGAARGMGHAIGMALMREGANVRNQSQLFFRLSLVHVVITTHNPVR